MRRRSEPHMARPDRRSRCVVCEATGPPARDESRGRRRPETLSPESRPPAVRARSEPGKPSRRRLRPAPPRRPGGPFPRPPAASEIVCANDYMPFGAEIDIGGPLSQERKSVCPLLALPRHLGGFNLLLDALQRELLQ